MSKRKVFTVSMPAEAYDLYKQKAEAGGMSVSEFLYRAGSIITVEQAVTYPLTRDNMGTVTQT